MSGQKTHSTANEENPQLHDQSLLFFWVLRMKEFECSSSSSSNSGCLAAAAFFIGINCLEQQMQWRGKISKLVLSHLITSRDLLPSINQSHWKRRGNCCLSASRIGALMRAIFTCDKIDDTSCLSLFRERNYKEVEFTLRSSVNCPLKTFFPEICALKKAFLSRELFPLGDRCSLSRLWQQEDALSFHRI